MSVRYLPDGAVFFRVGPPVWVGIFALFVFLGFGVLFVIGAARGGEELRLFGRMVLGPAATSAAGYLMAGLMGLGAVGTGIGVRRRIDGGAWIRLEKQRLVICGIGPTGEERTIHFRDIDNLESIIDRSGRVLTIRCRDGGQTDIPSVLFTRKGAFETFFAELDERVAG